MENKRRKGKRRKVNYPLKDKFQKGAWKKEKENRKGREEEKG